MLSFSQHVEPTLIKCMVTVFRVYLLFEMGYIGLELPK